MTSAAPPSPTSTPAPKAGERALVWPHRLAVALVCVVFPLIWVGGLVTSYNAGMAVPDWPNTYGYNLFLYPWTTWIFGPWDLFIEHGHRLLGALAGLVTIAFVVAVFRATSSKPLRLAAVAALGLVIGQGVLGGMRVLLNERQLAMIHGCTGPLFFAWCIGLATVTSRWWSARTKTPLSSTSPSEDVRDSFKRWATATFLIAYVQLVLGAQLRHAQVMLEPGAFRVLVFAHLAGAAALLAHVAFLACRTLRVWRNEPRITRPAAGLAVLVVMQIALGAGAWVVNYGWPGWSRLGGVGVGYTIQAESWMQANVVTAHVAVGSLILGVAAMLSLRSWRLSSMPLASAGGAFFAGEAIALASGASRGVTA